MPDVQPSIQPTDLLIRDALTGAYSRAVLEDLLPKEIERSRRDGTALTLCFFDIDHFKSINDAYGHGRGDDVLRALVLCIHEVTRSIDLLFRYGGDEFVLVLQQTRLEDARLVCERLFERLRSSVFAGDPPLAISISMGVASFPLDASDCDGLLRVADARNYLAKRLGRGQFVASDLSLDASLHGDAQGRLIERDQAIEVTRTFFQKLQTQRRGALAVVGEHGSGRTRFLEQIVHLAQLYKKAILRLPTKLSAQGRQYASLTAARWSLPLPIAANIEAFDRTLLQGLAQQGKDGLLIIVDDCALLDRATRQLVQQLVAVSTIPELGVVYSVEPGADPLVSNSACATTTITLAPLSEEGFKIWLFSLLHWEAPPPFVHWLWARTGGMPGRTQVALQQLMEEGLLRPAEDASWMISPGYLTYEFPAAAPEPPSPLHNFPFNSTKFIGRERECWQIDRLLETRRLVTLVGLGGIGKTRLALEVALARHDLYTDGVWFVSLESVQHPDQVLSAIARTLGLKEIDTLSVGERLKEYLRSKAMLLVLDNFEHVLEAADMVTDLLVAATELRMLITSRERLFVAGEQIFHVPPFSVPDPQAMSGQADLGDYGAIALFTDRARAVRPDFMLTDASTPVVTAICERLDGIPLAIEVAAARSAEFTPPLLFAQLDQHLTALPAGRCSYSERQLALCGTISWSYSLLLPEEQVLFRRLGVFVGTWSAVAASCTAWGEDRQVSADPQHSAAIADLLQSLQRKHLLRSHDAPDGTPGYTMLETIRELALEQIQLYGEAEQQRWNHALYYLTMVEQAEAELVGPNRAAWLAQFEYEYSNLSVALEWLISRQDIVRALRFATAFWKFWQYRGYPHEGRLWLDRALTLAEQYIAAQKDQVDEGELRMLQSLVAKGYCGAGWLAHDQGDYQAVTRYFEASLWLGSVLDDRRTVGLALQGIGSVSLLQGDYQKSYRCFEESQAIFYALGDLEEAAWATNHLACALRYLDDFDQAEVCFTTSIATFEQMGQLWGYDITLNNLAHMMLDTGRLDRVKSLLEPWLANKRAVHKERSLKFGVALTRLAEAYFQEGDLALARSAFMECLEISSQYGYATLVVEARNGLGRIALLQGDPQEARRCFHEGLQLERALRKVAQIAFLLEGVGQLALIAHDAPGAARFYGMVEVLRTINRVVVPEFYRNAYERSVADIRDRLEDGQFDSLYLEVQQLSLDQMLSSAITFLTTS